MTHKRPICLTSVWFQQSYRHVFSPVQTSDMPTQRLHPFKGLPTVITDILFPFSVYCLVSIQSTSRDKCLSAYFTYIRPFSCVSPDVSCEVGAVIEALFTNRAAVGLLSNAADVDNVVVVWVEG